MFRLDTDIVQRSAAILRQKTKYTFVCANVTFFRKRKNCVREDEVAHYNDFVANWQLKYWSYQGR